ncbi:DUF2799 domain-containing protein [Vibrio parahaemolyticus]|uniref:DUF2799 domain-containing protein n=1 Tax=Vibrio parahaemolyticus TaxID=670 RepID=UPI0011216692|nr:DUF2799 domain-containing protein [Vibrio parahaemolyticus]MBM5099559.1 DUF2799 domain-containing protein [Vibrio parahaemolyticus]MBM5103419.1 DUF2799 domain-containing protein [Vibrio parahaemolyticus]TOI83987.1 DNA repair protein [Vibrio parahaemolyticus]
MKRIALLFAMFALLSGCSSMSPEQCQTADWYRVGYQDGRSGNNPNILYEYIKDCREAGVTPNHVEWQDGFDKGTILYCSPDNGYTVGVEGKTYYGVCSNDLFLKNYQLGHQEYQRQQHINALDAEISRLDHQLDANLDKDNAKRIRERRKQLARERASLISPGANYYFNF